MNTSPTRYYLFIFVFILPLTVSGSGTDSLHSATDPTSAKQPLRTKTLRPHKKRTFVAGPSLIPSQDLLAWLEGLPGGVRVRLPVVIGSPDDKGTFRHDAFIAESPDDLNGDSILVQLDDTAMGIPLAEHLRRYRSEETTERAIWLEGTWGALISPPMAPLPVQEDEVGKRKRYPFTVRLVLDPVGSETEGRVFVERH